MPVYSKREQAARDAWTRLVTPLNEEFAKAKYDAIHADLVWEQTRKVLRAIKEKRKLAVAEAKAERKRIFATIPPSNQEISHRAKAEAAQDEYARSHSPNW